MLADMIPLPSDETTPPVTKMYLEDCMDIGVRFPDIVLILVQSYRKYISVADKINAVAAKILFIFIVSPFSKDKNRK